MKRLTKETRLVRADLAPQLGLQLRYCARAKKKSGPKPALS
jgi:hypothetical protein